MRSCMRDLTGRASGPGLSGFPGITPRRLRGKAEQPKSVAEGMGIDPPNHKRWAVPSANPGDPGEPQREGTVLSMISWILLYVPLIPAIR